MILLAALVVLALAEAIFRGRKALDRGLDEEAPWPTTKTSRALRWAKKQLAA